MMTTMIVRSSFSPCLRRLGSPLVAAVGAALLAALTLASTACTQLPAGAAATPAPRASLRLLTIGNSFSDNATEYLPQLAKAGGKELVLAKASLGGCSLERHARLARAAEDSPTSTTGRAYGKPGEKYSLQEALVRDQWDVVTVQQFSGDSFKPETYEPHARELAERVHRLAPRAELVIHETWAYRDDSPLFKDGFTQEGMYAGLRGAYEALGRELACRQIPVGDAIQSLRRSPGWKFERDAAFDYDHPTSGTLPAERRNINGGAYWDKKTGKFSIDYNHCNVYGKYLGAAVWYEALFHDDVTRVAWAPTGISARDAAFLRRVAHRVVTGGERPALPAEGTILTRPPAIEASTTTDPTATAPAAATGAEAPARQ